MRANQTKWRHLILSLAIIAGLILTNHHFSHREPPLIKISEIKPLMNFSTVRVEGELEVDAQRLKNESVFFVINDGSGSLPVFCDGSSNIRIPHAGTKVRVNGVLNVGANNNIRMRTKRGEPIYILGEPGSTVFKSAYDLSNLAMERRGKRLTVYGRVARYWTPRKDSRAPYKIVLEDHSGSIDVVHWLDDIELEVGDEIEVYGQVNEYKGRLQLRLWNADGLHPYVTEHTLSQSN